jgi:hypothetical protein
VVAADTDTSVLPQVQRRCADATAQLVLKAARRTRKKIKTKARKNRPDRGPKTAMPAPPKPENRCSGPGPPEGADKGPGHDSANPRKRHSPGGTHVAPT